MPRSSIEPVCEIEDICHPHYPHDAPDENQRFSGAAQQTQAPRRKHAIAKTYDYHRRSDFHEELHPCSQSEDVVKNADGEYERTPKK